MDNIGYIIILNSHLIEKKLSCFNLKKFGKNTIKSLIKLLKKDLIYDNYPNDFSFINGINILREYIKIYKKNNWTNEIEYKKTSLFLKKFKNIKKQKVGAYLLNKEQLKNNYNIDYMNFVRSRHSIQNYQQLKLKSEDIREAIETAKYSPSASNKQNIKVHYYLNDKMKRNIIDFISRKKIINIKGINVFVITYDSNGLEKKGERNQGYFNAGLFSMNLINAFHSKGIGSCLIQFDSINYEEEKFKKFNKIPTNQRIAVILFTGYYNKKFKIKK